MKNFSKILFVFAFVFVLAKLQMGSGTVYYNGIDSNTTSDISQAKVFESMSEVYDCQNKLGGDWQIITVN